MRGADGGGEVEAEGRRRAACLGLTGACCRPGAGRRLGSPPTRSSPSLDAPWQPGSPLWSQVPRRVSEGCGSAQPPIGRLANRRPGGQRAGQCPPHRPHDGSPCRTLVPGPPVPRAVPGCPRPAPRPPRGGSGAPRGGAPAFRRVRAQPPSRAGAPRERARSPVPRLCAWTPRRPRKTDYDGRKAGLEIRAREYGGAGPGRRPRFLI